MTANRVVILIKVKNNCCVFYIVGYSFFSACLLSKSCWMSLNLGTVVNGLVDVCVYILAKDILSYINRPRNKVR